jgi:two-component system, chemotaxis family, sensor kinase CheA
MAKPEVSSPASGIWPARERSPMGSNDDMIKEFLVESYENLDRLDQQFLVLEKDPTNCDTLGSIFRTIHTIKGTCGFFGLLRLQSLTHVGENLLSKLRDGKLILTKEMANALLAMVDAVRGMLGKVEETGSDGSDDHGPLIAQLTALLDEQPTAQVSAPPAQAEQSPAASASTVGPLTAMFEAANAKREAEAAAAAREKVAQEKAAQAKSPSEQKHSAESSALVPAVAASNTATKSDAVAKSDVPAKSESAAKSGESAGGSLADTTIRVEVEVLDRLMNLVGELVLARNQILQFSQSLNDHNYVRTTQRLNALTTELQENVMKTRMQPIGNVWSKFPRVVRDLSVSCGKQVRVDMDGKETEMDKTLIEAIKDPLTHIVRNSVDHGIEKPDVRVAAGKPAEGILLLKAFHEGGQVVIEISDDGGGINTKRVVDKALEKGLITTEIASKMSERDKVNLIFAPGFSTAEKVTNISGRGVGMDVVKTNIERIGGNVEVINRPGQGSTMRIKIPLTLAIIPALVVMSGGERFAIPQVSLVELLRLEPQQQKNDIEYIYGAPVYRLRGQLLPVVFLSKELGLKTAAEERPMTMVILQAEQRRFCLMVEGVHDAQEIVVKPLSHILKPLSVYAGATIMGDGRVALILDVVGIAKRSHAVTKAAERYASETDASGDQQNKAKVQSMMLFVSPDDGRMAIPVSQIARLEEIECSRVERAGDANVVQYRGQILPLLRVFDLLPERRKEPRNPDCGVSEGVLQVVIHTHGERSVGLVVGRILDTVEQAIVIERAASRPGIIGCIVIENRVTELLDVKKLVSTAIPDFYEQLQPV